MNTYASNFKIYEGLIHMKKIIVFLAFAIQSHHLVTTTLSSQNNQLEVQELCAAAQKQDLKKIAQLVRKGVPVNAHDDNGFTPLHHALLSPNKKTPKVVQRLLEYGADASIKAHDDCTPLDLALETNHAPLQDVLIATQESHKKIKGHIPVDISFLIADMKYDQGSLKICELGEGTRSYFKGHEQLYGLGKIWENLWAHLRKFELPIWFIGTKPTTQTAREIALTTLTNSGGACVANLYELYQDPLFQEVKTLPLNNIHSIKDYRGIIVFRQQKEPRSAITQFKRKNPGFLILDSASTPFVNNKNVTNQLFVDDALQPFKPRWKT